jgi:hypothetical protein
MIVPFIICEAAFSIIPHSGQAHPQGINFQFHPSLGTTPFKQPQNQYHGIYLVLQEKFDCEVDYSIVFFFKS